MENTTDNHSGEDIPYYSSNNSTHNRSLASNEVPPFAGTEKKRRKKRKKKKRKNKQRQDDNAEPTSLQRPCIDIPEVPSGWEPDFSTEAETPEEYLHRVRWEAQHRCPPVTIATDINPSAYDDNRTEHRLLARFRRLNKHLFEDSDVDQDTALYGPGYRADPKWVTQFLEDFAAKREWICIATHVYEHLEFSLPSLGDWEGWKKYCWGQPEGGGIEPTAPSLAVLLSLEYQAVNQLLEQHVRWIVEDNPLLFKQLEGQTDVKVDPDNERAETNEEDIHKEYVQNEDGDGDGETCVSDALEVLEDTDKQHSEAETEDVGDQVTLRAKVMFAWLYGLMLRIEHPLQPSVSASLADLVKWCLNKRSGIVRSSIVREESRRDGVGHLNTVLAMALYFGQGSLNFM